MQPLSVQSAKTAAAALLPHTQRQNPERLRAQFAVWYLLLVVSRRGIQGCWSPSLSPASAADNLWLAVCVSACRVRLAPSASQSAKIGAESNTLLLMQCTVLHALAGSFGIAGSA
jgi:hypothetical protein